MNTENTEERLRQITDIEWAYAAAMVDGEGSLSLTMTYIKDRKGNLYPAFDCKTDISNTSVKLMDWLLSRFGGKTYLAVKHISKKARANGQKSMKPCYRWYCDGQENQAWFVKNIIPYLVIKREQAEIVLEYVGLSRNGRKGHREKRLELHLKMKALNKVGESVEANTPDTKQKRYLGKIESDLWGDLQSGPVVTPEAEKQGP